MTIGNYKWLSTLQLNLNMWDKKGKYLKIKNIIKIM